MSTPCILALGTRQAWQGVPCKLDGSLESTGPVVIDRVVRSGGVAAAAKHLITDAPLGWTWAGGERLDEEDEYLSGGGLSSSSPRDIFDRHYAIYLLDPTLHRLDIKIIPQDTWLAPVTFAERGPVTALPGWYPQPRADDRIEARPMPRDVRQKLDEYCTSNRIRATILMAALRDWCAALLGDLSGAEWIHLGGESDSGSACVAGRVGRVEVRASLDADGNTFTGSDGKLRTMRVNDIALAGKVFDALSRSPRHAGPLSGTGLPRPAHATPVIQLLLSAAYEAASGKRGAHVDWAHGSKEWMFFGPSGAGPFEVDYLPGAWLPLFLSWLLF